MKDNDIVRRPNHYQIAEGIEAIDIIEIVVEACCTTPYEGYLLGNFLKYRLRIGDKDDVMQDLAKSNQYRERLRELTAPPSTAPELDSAACNGDCDNCEVCPASCPMTCPDLLDRLQNEEFMRKLKRTDPYPANWDMVK